MLISLASRYVRRWAFLTVPVTRTIVPTASADAAQVPARAGAGMAPISTMLGTTASHIHAPAIVVKQRNCASYTRCALEEAGRVENDISREHPLCSCSSL